MEKPLYLEQTIVKLLNPIRIVFYLTKKLVLSCTSKRKLYYFIEKVRIMTKTYKIAG